MAIDSCYSFMLVSYHVNTRAQKLPLLFCCRAQAFFLYKGERQLFQWYTRDHMLNQQQRKDELSSIHSWSCLTESSGEPHHSVSSS